MYSLGTKTFFLIIAAILGLMIFQTMRMNDKEEIIEQQANIIQTQNGQLTNKPYDVTNVNDGKAHILTSNELYLRNKVSALEVKLQGLQNQIKALENENIRLKEQLTNAKEKPVFKLPDKKENVTSMKTENSDGYTESYKEQTKESFDVLGEKKAI